MQIDKSVPRVRRVRVRRGGLCGADAERQRPRRPVRRVRGRAHRRRHRGQAHGVPAYGDDRVRRAERDRLVVRRLPHLARLRAHRRPLPGHGAAARALGDAGRAGQVDGGGRGAAAAHRRRRGHQAPELRAARHLQRHRAPAARGARRDERLRAPRLPVHRAHHPRRQPGRRRPQLRGERACRHRLGAHRVPGRPEQHADEGGAAREGLPDLRSAVRQHGQAQAAGGPQAGPAAVRRRPEGQGHLPGRLGRAAAAGHPQLHGQLGRALLHVQGGGGHLLRPGVRLRARRLHPRLPLRALDREDRLAVGVSPVPGCVTYAPPGSTGSRSRPQ